MSDTPELTKAAMSSAIPASQRRRLLRGDIATGKDVSALRRFVGLSQVRFAEALGISVHTLRNWEQGRRWPEGPALALLRIAARHPRIIRENLEDASDGRIALDRLDKPEGWCSLEDLEEGRDRRDAESR